METLATGTFTCQSNRCRAIGFEVKGTAVAYLKRDGSRIASGRHFKIVFKAAGFTVEDEVYPRCYLGIADLPVEWNSFNPIRAILARVVVGDATCGLLGLQMYGSSLKNA
jgi:hypothetical protein